MYSNRLSYTITGRVACSRKSFPFSFFFPPDFLDICLSLRQGKNCCMRATKRDASGRWIPPRQVLLYSGILRIVPYTVLGIEYCTVIAASESRNQAHHEAKLRLVYLVLSFGLCEWNRYQMLSWVSVEFSLNIPPSVGLDGNEANDLSDDCLMEKEMKWMVVVEVVVVVTRTNDKTKRKRC